MPENIGSSQNGITPRLLIVCGDLIDFENIQYPREFLNVIQSPWNPNELNSTFNFPNIDIWFFLPPTFSILPEIDLLKVMQLFVGRKEYRAMYADFNTTWESKDGPVTIEQYLPDLNRTMVSLDYVIEAPFCCYGVNSPIFSGEINLCWSAIKLIARNVPVYHYPYAVTEKKIGVMKWPTPVAT